MHHRMELARKPSDSQHPRARGLAISAAALLLLHYSALELAGGIAGRLGVLGIGMTIWCAAVSGFLLYRSPNVVQRSVHLPRDS